MRICAVLLSAIALALPLLGAAEESAGVEEELAALRLAVASFEAVAPPDSDVPDVAAALAERLREKGAGSVVGPSDVPATKALDEAATRAFAERSGAEVVLVGRTTRMGSRLSVDVRLLQAASGGVAGTYVAELDSVEPGAPGLDGLADQVLAAVLALEPVPPAQVPSAQVQVGGVSVEIPADVGGRKTLAGATALESAAPFGLGSVDTDQPLSIRADELEASDRDGDRMLVFRHDVVVSQGEVTLRSERLEAFYPDGEKQPRRLVATGEVTLRQGDREARCERAVYERPTSRIICEGSAWLRDGDNRLHGERIVFDLAARRVSVTGGTEVLLHPREGSEHALGLGGQADPEAPEEREDEAEEPGPAGLDELDLGAYQSDAPVTIRSEQLEAFQADGQRQIVFERGVEVAQADVKLRANRLQAVYPEDSDQPDRLVATGEVSLVQGEREANCDQAIYHRPEQRVDCVGSAVLRDGGDQVRGDVIAFDLASQSVSVKGATRLLIRPNGDDGGRILQ